MSLQRLETALKARTCFALDGVENKRAAAERRKVRESERERTVCTGDPNTRSRVYPAIDRYRLGIPLRLRHAGVSLKP